jgi:hypothetical protein
MPKGSFVFYIDIEGEKYLYWQILLDVRRIRVCSLIYLIN